METLAKIAVILLVVLAVSFAVIIVIGHIYPQQTDTFGDKYLGPFFYGRQPS